ncbi:glycosyltransferase family 1 protein [Geobacter sp. SVR]|uniref:glycosyltransferase family 4 protein n=1 Tax=Geobacter sp. SVR TaxID=2495594 RepID=UPI00143EFC30|nr:glycosyltransferase family 1 protein [Geobacter sp. SVR]BCS55015.1 glycosyl transferase family 1 [Geobacter sp. SVR]GCF85196.1 glycosyl transferase family 1 [Geobacter sp. SVR]
MELIIDDRWFGETGIGRYVNEIIKRKPDNCHILHLNQNWKIKNPLSPWLLASTIKKSHADLFWSPGFMPPAGCKTPFVVSVHDLMHLHYGNSLQRLYYNQVIRRLLHNAATVLTVSEYSRNELLSWSGISAEKVVVTHNAVGADFSCEGTQYNPGFPYVLYVGNRRIYKNVNRLIEAFSLGCKRSDVKLVLSGTADPELLAIARQAGIADRIIFIGRIKEEDLSAVYRGALAVAYVSLYEGFGLPPLEAMACGTPVLTSNVTSLPEVVGDAALMVDPFDVEAIADGLRRITEDSGLQLDLQTKGLKRVELFSWDISAKKIWEVLNRAAQI